MKFCECCGDEIATKDGDNKCNACEERVANGQRATKKAALTRKQRHKVLTDLGMRKVRGALGGTYYE